MTDLDQLIELATTQAETATGLPVSWIAANHGRMANLALPNAPAPSPRMPAWRMPAWTVREDQFLERNLGWMSIEQIAAQLGRTVNAVNLRWKRDLKLPAPSKAPGWLTGQGVARIFDVYVHAVMKWIDRGLLPGRTLPNKRKIRMVRRATLRRWAVNPMNWIYFMPAIKTLDRISDPHLRALIKRQKERWNDAWWTPGQVAAYHGVHHTDVNRYLHAGKLKGVKWGNWWILRSEATKPGLLFFKGKGAAQGFDWNEEADAFLLLARAVGLSWIAIGVLMNGWSGPRVAHRAGAIRRQGQIPLLIGKYGLQIEHTAATGDLFADWRIYRHRFPHLEAAVERFQRGTVRFDDLVTVSRVLGAWARRYAAGEQQKRLAFNLEHSNKASERYVRKAYRILVRGGIDPLLFAKTKSNMEASL